MKIRTESVAGDASADRTSVAQAPARRQPFPQRFLRVAFRTVGPIAPGAMGRLAFHLWFRTVRPRVRDHEAAAIARARETRVRIDGLRVAVYTWGSGPTVVLLHGWNGRAAQMTSFVTPLLGAGYQVVAFDAPAHGRSAGARTNVFEIMRALEAVTTQCATLAGIVAHSMGALCCSIAMADRVVSAPRAVCLAPVVTPAPLVANFAAALELPDPVRAMLLQRLDGWVGRDFWSRAVMPAPALLIHDEDDAVIPYGDSQRLLKLWPDAQLHSTRQLGHYGILRDPEVVERVVEFLRRPPRPA